MTYHLWIAGREHGPFTLAQLIDRRDSGQWPDGAYWRRETHAEWQPLPTLETERAAAAAVSARAAASASASGSEVGVTEIREPEPRGQSVLGIIFHVLAMLVFVLSVMFCFGEDTRSYGFAGIGIAVGLMALGTFFHIYAVLWLIAHRLRK